MFDDSFYTVTELNETIKEVLNRGLSDSVWVCGEIQGFNRNRDKKHIFFELCEKDPVSHEIMARIGLVIFAGKKGVIQETLKRAENAFALKDDIEVKFLCRVDFYPPHGAVRLIVESIDPIYTLGKIAQSRQKLIAHLKKKGLLDKNKKLEFPLVPLTIGLITSDDSAAFNDFIAELKRSRYSFCVYMVNSLMQGKRAEGSVCDALGVLGKIPKIDMVVITRGGGSIADLSCFDSEAIAKKIASMRVPVLSGIGHEINFTVTDMAAHTFAKTPTAAAQMITQRVEEFLACIEESALGIIRAMEETVDKEKRKIKELALCLQTRTMSYLEEHHQNIARFTEQIVSMPLSRIKENVKDIETQKKSLVKVVEISLKQTKVQMKHFQEVVEIVSPVNTLKRGFSITRNKQGQVLKSIKQVEKKEDITTHLADGVIKSTVQ